MNAYHPVIITCSNPNHHPNCTGEEEHGGDESEDGANDGENAGVMCIPARRTRRRMGIYRTQLHFVGARTLPVQTRTHFEVSSVIRTQARFHFEL